MGGSESEGYAPIVGAGPNSTALHYDRLDRKIQDGDIVVLDVGAQYSGYSADITRTLPANGKFTPRQREIYDIVLGAQNAAIAAIKPGAIFCRNEKDGLFNIAYNYINTHGKDLHGKPLGQYFIHGLGHGIGLDVHDPGAPCKPLVPGMVVTIEPASTFPRKISASASKTISSSPTPASNSSAKNFHATLTPSKKLWPKPPPTAQTPIARRCRCFEFS